MIWLIPLGFCEKLSRNRVNAIIELEEKVLSRGGYYATARRLIIKILMRLGTHQ